MVTPDRKPVYFWFKRGTEARVRAMPCVCSPLPSVFHSLKSPKVRAWVLLSPCKRDRSLVDARLLTVKQKVFLSRVWLCTMKTHGSGFQPWFTAVISLKYWAGLPCKSPILRLITLTINSKWNSGPLCLLLEEGRKKENNWNLK